MVHRRHRRNPHHHRLGAGVSYDADASALFARFTTPADSTRKGHINTLIVALKAAGIWTKLDRLWIMAAADSQAAQRNWIADANNLTEVSSPTFTTDRGYQGNGTSSYVTGGTYASLTKFTRNDCCMFGWMWDSAAVATSCFGADGNFNILLAGRAAGNVMFTRVNDGTGTTTQTVTDGKGLCGFSRALSTEYNSFKGDTLALVTVTTTNNPANTVSAGKTGTQFSLGKFSALGVGSSLNQTEITALNNAMTAYMTAVGAV
jgi:hypothetical protein